MKRGPAVPVGQVSEGAVSAVQISGVAVYRSAEVAAAATVTKGLVVLPSQVWRAELASELERLGFDSEKAGVSAGHVLHRVCGHAGWPMPFFIVDDSTSEDAP